MQQRAMLRPSLYFHLHTHSMLTHHPRLIKVTLCMSALRRTCATCHAALLTLSKSSAASVPPDCTVPGESSEAEEGKDSCSPRAQGPCLRLQGLEASTCHRDPQQPIRAGGPFTFSGPDSHGMSWPALWTGQLETVVALCCSELLVAM